MNKTILSIHLVIKINIDYRAPRVASDLNNTISMKDCGDEIPKILSKAKF